MRSVCRRADVTSPANGLVTANEGEAPDVAILAPVGQPRAQNPLLEESGAPRHCVRRLVADDAPELDADEAGQRLVRPPRQEHDRSSRVAAATRLGSEPVGDARAPVPVEDEVDRADELAVDGDRQLRASALLPLHAYLV